MIDQLKTWQHAGLSLMILMIVLGIFYLLIINPAIVARVQFNDRVESLHFQQEKLIQLLGQRDQLMEDAGQLEQYRLDEANFLEEKTVPLVAADLQRILNTLISDHGGTVVSTQVVNNRDNELFQKVTINVNLRGDIEALQRILFEIKQNKPVLFIDNLMINLQGGRRAPRQTNPRSRRQLPATATPDLLDVKFEISGYIYKSDISI